MGRDKLWIEVSGRPLLGWTLQALAAAARVDHLTVVAPRPHWDEVRGLAACGAWTVAVCEGGDRRQDSVRAGLEATPPADVVAVHDAARPAVTARLLGAVVDAAREHGAATAAVPVVDSMTRVDATGAVVETVPRAGLWAVQTPQAFAAGLLLEAHARAVADAVEADDDAALVARLGHRVQVVEGDRANLKITHDDDLAAFTSRLAAR